MWLSKNDFNTLVGTDTLAAAFAAPLESNFHNEHENRSVKSEPPSRENTTLCLQKQKQLIYALPG